MKRFLLGFAMCFLGGCSPSFGFTQTEISCPGELRKDIEKLSSEVSILNGVVLKTISACNGVIKSEENE